MWRRVFPYVAKLAWVGITPTQSSGDYLKGYGLRIACIWITRIWTQFDDFNSWLLDNDMHNTMRWPTVQGWTVDVSIVWTHWLKAGHVMWLTACDWTSQPPVLGFWASMVLLCAVACFGWHDFTSAKIWSTTIGNSTGQPYVIHEALDCRKL